MTDEQAASWLLHAYGFVGIVGLVLLALVFIFWKSVGDYVADSWAKVAVEGVSLLVVGSSIATTFAAATERGHWRWPAFVGGVCLAVWKVLQIFVDNRVKAADAKQKTEAEVYERQAANLARLIAVLHESVKHKVKRLVKVLARKNGAGRIEHVRAALTPHPHLDDLLDAVAAFFCEQLPETERQVRTFRVGVYVARNNVMVPVHGVSNRAAGFNPFSSSERYQDYFRLNAAQPSNVVRAISEKGIVVVPDCGEAASSGKFHFFNPNQASYLRSMVSLYLGHVWQDGDTMVPAALSIDTDAPGFFKESDRETIRYHLQEFGVRIKLELLLQSLIEKKGSADERKADPDDS